ncbi:transcription factor Adf-1 isoform X1 [Drosophila miranda]|uniref:transcription factor Adf-1 isoform X1 n=1 Tax=Drosophila miranda TaxID=7229 RepID=UPI0007E6D345|nr:transcription factor Adf-1 isoform X1 [Drosophila miranda]
MFIMRTSYKKNRPFDFKLINLVEPHPVLYRRSGLSTYDAMKAKTDIWTQIAKIMGCDVDFCLMRWNNLHYQFRKEFRRADTKGSSWPYLERLRFLANIRPGGAKSKVTAEDSTPSPDKTMSTQENEGSPSEAPIVVWEEFNDGSGIDLENSYIIEEIIEEASDEVMHEEIIYEDIEEHKINSSESDKQQMVGSPICPRSYFFKMDEILDQFKQPQRQRAERRIMAFLLKCQLRSLHKQPVDDLVI